MDYYDILLGKKLGGSSTTIEALSVTENGTYSEEGKAYSPVTVNVSGGGGSLDLHPKVTMNVTVEGNSTSMVKDALIVDDRWVVIQGNNTVDNSEFLSADSIVNFNNGDTKEVDYVLPLGTASYGVYNSIITNHQFLQSITFANCVNCTGDDQGGLEITDNTQDASADVTLTFTGGD